MKKKIKTYVPDTSAFLMYPDLIFRIKDGHEIAIPDAVIRELNGLKRNIQIHVAEAASEALNLLQQVRGNCDLHAGVALITGLTLRVDGGYEPIDDLASPADNRIVGAALKLKNETRAKVTVLSSDTNMRIVSRAYGLNAEFPVFHESDKSTCLEPALKS